VRSRDELKNLLGEQVDFLRSSAAAFDAGILHEYKRLAVVLRVLLHDLPDRGTHSLLDQLGVKSSLRFLNTRYERPDVPGRQVLEPLEWPFGMVVRSLTLGSEETQFESGARRQSPMLGADPERHSRKAFEAWWNDPIIETTSGRAYSRWDCVRGPANQEGGTHVDPRPKEWWIALRDTSWDNGGYVASQDGVVAIRLLIPPIVRQVAYEVNETLTDQHI
jgi:hypothetical protein